MFIAICDFKDVRSPALSNRSPFGSAAQSTLAQARRTYPCRQLEGQITRVEHTTRNAAARLHLPCMATGHAAALACRRAAKVAAPGAEHVTAMFSFS